MQDAGNPDWMHLFPANISMIKMLYAMIAVNRANEGRPVIKQPETVCIVKKRG